MLTRLLSQTRRRWKSRFSDGRGLLRADEDEALCRNHGTRPREQDKINIIIIAVVVIFSTVQIIGPWGLYDRSTPSL